MPVFMICGAESDNGFRLCVARGKPPFPHDHEFVEADANMTKRHAATLQAERDAALDLLRRWMAPDGTTYKANVKSDTRKFLEGLK